jgi:preprotein translocase subunit SecF
MRKVILLSLFLILVPVMANVKMTATTSVEYSMELKGKKNVKVKSYKKKDGTKVKSHKRSKPTKKRKK